MEILSLRKNDLLNSYENKMWFRKHNHNYFEKTNPIEGELLQNSPPRINKNPEKTSVIKKKYLMSKQEIRQEAIIE